jgi:hypothetical protein
MSSIENVFDSIFASYNNEVMATSIIIAVLLSTLVLSAYEFVVYRLVSHRAFYNKSFNVCIAVLPLFVSTIILCLQSNLVITLGTIGALAIIRFRTAIKDPVDMIYILWSVHIGITCGCQLYEVALLTSIFVTVVLIVLENLNMGKKPFVLVFHCESGKEKEILEKIEANTRSYKVKSRNFKKDGMDYVVEISVKDPETLVNAMKETQIEKFSLIEYDNEDIL